MYATDSRFRRLRRRRGSTILIVLALLSVLILLAATLAYTSRIELTSSQNFGRSVQNRMAALTGVQQASNSLALGLEEESTLTRGTLSGAGKYRAPKDVRKDEGTPVQPGVVAESRFADSSARINVNTASADVLERLITQALRAATPAPDANPRAVAAAIVAFRLGPDGLPGRRGDDDRNADGALGVRRNDAGVLVNETDALLAKTPRDSSSVEGDSLSATLRVLLSGEDDPAEYVSDPRLPAFGDDQRFHAINDLLKVPGMTTEVLALIEPQITVFSLSRTGWLRDGEQADPLDMNRASAKEIYEALQRLYGGTKDDTLLRQFALNLVDSRDEDSVPTLLWDSLGDDEFFGFERTPVISEVYADSITEDRDGDDGQYVELYNPWNEAISLSGWSLKVGGARHSLTGTLPARGFLIVTDDYRNDANPNEGEELNGQGSFYDVFGIVTNGSSRRVLEVRNLSIAHSPGSHRVQLNDNAGNAIDAFRYTVPGEHSPLNSFQRRNVLVREVFIERATPFTMAKADAASVDASVLLAGLPLDRAFVTPVEIFDVFAGSPGSETSRWGFPVVASPSSADAAAQLLATDRALLDARILDLFIVELTNRRTAEQIRADHRDLDGDGRLSRAPDPYRGETSPGNPADELALQWSRYAEKPIGWRLGRVNVNTASAEVLRAVGFSEAQLRALETRRRTQAGSGVLYSRLSDLLVDATMWSGNLDRADRLAAYALLHAQLTVGSQSFLVEGQGVSVSESGDVSKEGLKLQAVMAVENDSAQPVAWRFAQ